MADIENRGQFEDPTRIINGSYHSLATYDMPGTELGRLYVSAPFHKEKGSEKEKKFFPKAVQLVRGRIRIQSITWDQYVQGKGKSQVSLKGSNHLFLYRLTPSGHF